MTIIKKYTDTIVILQIYYDIVQLYDSCKVAKLFVPVKLKKYIIIMIKVGVVGRGYSLLDRYIDIRVL